MIEILYKPEDAGKKIINSRGKEVTIRKYHMTETEKLAAKKRWKKDILNVDKRIRNKSGRKFFNPYRRGIYYYQVQALFLLEANEWHSLPDILKKMEEYMSEIPSKSNKLVSEWDKYRTKGVRDFATRGKDFIGKIQENFILLQRLSQLNPYGYKLRQVGASIDIKRVDKKGFLNGMYYYRLTTHGNENKAYPLRDFRKFTFPKTENKFVSMKFLGTVLTKKRTIKNGIVT